MKERFPYGKMIFLRFCYIISNIKNIKRKEKVEFGEFLKLGLSGDDKGLLIQFLIKERRPVREGNRAAIFVGERDRERSELRSINNSWSRYAQIKSSPASALSVKVTLGIDRVRMKIWSFDTLAQRTGDKGKAA